MGQVYMLFLFWLRQICVYNFRFADDQENASLKDSPMFAKKPSMKLVIFVHNCNYKKTC